jgi:hypothetical protein
MSCGQEKKCVYHIKAVVLLALVLGLAGFGQQAPDPIATLRHTRERLLADLDRMPRYTCVQTITRTYYDARSRLHGSSCSALIANNARKHTPSAFGWDRLRLEVAWVNGNNVFSWVGAPRFANDNLEKLAGDGPLGSGDFGVLLHEILLRTTLDFQREQVINGKRLLEYSYDMPLEKSTYKVKTSDGWTPIPYGGTLLIDPEAADLARLTIHIPKLPPSSSACQATNELTYGRTSIHDRLVLIPRDTRLDIINISGTESQSQTSFANCREYAATVRVLLDDSQSTSGTQAVTPSAAASPAPLPAGLQFDARIITPIDSDTAAAGDPIEAVLRSPLHGKNKAVIAPVGVRIHGRLTNVRWRSKPTSNLEIAARFESIEIDGRDVPFTAILESPRPKVLTGTTVSTSQMTLLKHDDPSLGGTFRFPQEHLRLKNLDAQWVTVTPEARTEEK